MVTAETCRAKPHQYSDCKLVRQNTTRAEKKCGADDEKMQLDTSQTKLYAQLQADINASEFGARDSLAKKNKIVQEVSVCTCTHADGLKSGFHCRGL